MLDRRQIQAVVFDAYCTLLDVRSVESACAALSPDPVSLVTLWRAKQLEYTFQRSLMERYVDFWQVTAEALAYSAARLGLELDESSRARLMDAWLDLEPFPEAEKALQSLASRRLAVLSNGSPRMLETVLERSGLRRHLTHVFSVDQVAAYKPSPLVYAIAPRLLGLARRVILFVSGNSWDAAGAASYGFQVAWINRAGLPFDRLGQRPDVEVRDLSELAAQLGR